MSHEQFAKRYPTAFIIVTMILAALTLCAIALFLQINVWVSSKEATLRAFNTKLIGGVAVLCGLVHGSIGTFMVCKRALIFCRST